MLFAKIKIFVLLFSLTVAQNFYAQTPKAKIGLLLSDLYLERWSKDRDCFVAKSKELNYETIVKNAMNDQELQNQQADSVIKAGAKILVVVPVDAYKAATIVENAHRNGVKVIAYDRLIMNCDLDSYVSYDNETTGKIMAIYVTMHFAKGRVAYIGGPKSDMNSIAIRKGLLEGLDPYFKNNSMVLICDTFTNTWSSRESKDILIDFLSKNKCPDIIFNANDELAEGVIDVLDQKGLSGKVLVTGQDADLKACRNLVSGKQTLTIFKPIRVLAERAVLFASGLMGDIPFIFISEVNNGKVNVQSLILIPVPVGKNNLENTVIREGFHTKEEIFGN